MRYMIRLILQVIIILGLVIAPVAYGQDPIDTPPPAVDTIFRDYINVLNTTVVGRLDQPLSVATDDEKRIVTVEIDDEIKEYPYPTDFVEIWSSGFVNYTQNPIFTTAIGDQNVYYEPYAIYELDIVSGDFSLYEPCLGTIIEGSASGTINLRPEWVFVLDPQVETVQLCNQNTGRLSGPLPGSYIGGPGGWSDIVQSPQEDFLLLIAGSNSGGYYAFYGFNLTTETITSLGSIGGQSFLGDFQDWINDTQFVFEIYASIDGRNGIYTGDITQPDSFARTFWDDANALGYNGFELFRNMANCTVAHYPWQSIQVFMYELGNHCEAIYRLPNSTYIALLDDTETSRRLVKQGAMDTEPIILHEGEIEYLCSVSPTGRYVILLTDENGQVGEVKRGQFTTNEVATWQIEVFDVVTQETIYTEPDISWCTSFYDDRALQIIDANPNQPRQAGLYWLNEQTVLFNKTFTQHLLVFDNNQLVRTETHDDIYRAFLNTDYLILQSGDLEDATTYQIYNVLTDKRLPLFAIDFPTDDYTVRLVGRDPIRVQVIPRHAENSSAYYVDYTIELSFD